MDAIRHRELIDALLPTPADQSIHGLDNCGLDNCGLDAAELAELRAALASDPGLAAEWHRVQAWDQQLAGALDDVPVPADMAQRLLAAVSANQENARDTVVLPAKPAGTPSSPSRRIFIIGGVAAALAASLLVALMLVPPATKFVESAALVEDVRLELQELDDVWRTDLANAPQTEYRFDDAALIATPRRWRLLDTAIDRQAVAYDLAAPGRKRALLIVMQAEHVKSDLSSFPLRDPANTEGVCIGAWQRNGLIYVLVVDGTPARYGSFLKEISTG